MTSGFVFFVRAVFALACDAALCGAVGALVWGPGGALACAVIGVAIGGAIINDQWNTRRVRVAQARWAARHGAIASGAHRTR